MIKEITLNQLILWLSLVACVSCYTGFKRGSGNGCPESSPWPCKTPGTCLSFDFICDGEADCPDNYDEDPALCIAKDRPAAVLIEHFIHEWKDWLIPKILGNKPIKVLAKELIESKTIGEYAKAVDLTPEQKENLKTVMNAVQEGRQVDLLLMGMPSRAWNQLYVLFRRIVESGFMKKSF